MDYCNFLSTNEPTYADFYFPQITNFETIEAFDIDDIYTPVALDNKLLHASFDNPLTMEKGERFFTAAVTEGWNQRQKSYDAISQKYSDAILGYERVRDIHDPEKIYRAYSGFMDSEFSDGFEPVSDDDYSKVVSGYINK